MNKKDDKIKNKFDILSNARDTYSIGRRKLHVKNPIKMKKLHSIIDDDYKPIDVNIDFDNKISIKNKSEQPLEDIEVPITEVIKNVRVETFYYVDYETETERDFYNTGFSSKRHRFEFKKGSSNGILYDCLYTWYVEQVKVAMTESHVIFTLNNNYVFSFSIEDIKETKRYFSRNIKTFRL